MDLYDVEVLHNKIAKKQEHIEWLRSLVDVKSPMMGNTRVQSDPNPDKLSDVVNDIIKADKELQELVDRYIKLQCEVLMKLEKIDNDLQRTILKLKYLNFRTLLEITDETGYSYVHIKRLHKEALEKYKMIP